jgi:hypothetical protein
MRRRRRYPDQEFPLPWQIEGIFWFIGLLCVPLGMWWMLNEITTPAAMFSDMLGIAVDTQPVVEVAPPLIWIVGILLGVRIRCWLRTVVVEQLNKVM